MLFCGVALPLPFAGPLVLQRLNVLVCLSSQVASTLHWVNLLSCRGGTWGAQKMRKCCCIFSRQIHSLGTDNCSDEQAELGRAAAQRGTRVLLAWENGDGSGKRGKRDAAGSARITSRLLHYRLALMVSMSFWKSEA